MDKKKKKVVTRELAALAQYLRNDRSMARYVSSEMDQMIDFIDDDSEDEFTKFSDKLKEQEE